MPSWTVTIATILLVIFALVALTASKLLPARAMARRLHTYQATVVDKTTERTVAYVGVFIPIETHYLVVEGGRKVKVDRTAFRAIRIGDTVTVSGYSDGSHRLETIRLST